MYYVYLLRLNNKNIYTGSTPNIKHRILTHKAGKVLSTKNYRPAVLMGYEAYLLKSSKSHLGKGVLIRLTLPVLVKGIPLLSLTSSSVQTLRACP